MKKIILITAMISAAGGQYATAQTKDTTIAKASSSGRTKDGKYYLRGTDENGKPVFMYYRRASNRQPSSKEASATSPSKSPLTDSALLETVVHTVLQKYAAEQKLSVPSFQGTYQFNFNGTNAPINLTISDGRVKKDSMETFAAESKKTAPPDEDSMIVMDESLLSLERQCGGQYEPERLGHQDYAPGKKRYHRQERKKFARVFETCAAVKTALHLMRTNDSTLGQKAVNLFNTEDGVLYCQKNADGKWHAYFAEGKYNAWQFTQAVRLVYSEERRDTEMVSSLYFVKNP